MYLRYHAGRSMRHVGSAIAEGALIVGIAGALVFGVAVVGGSNPAGADGVAAGGGAAIWIDSGTARSAGGLNYTDNVDFGYNKVAVYSTIQLQCYQGGALVFSDSRPTWEGGLKYGESFTLGPSFAWSGGDADCVAKLGHRTNGGKWRTDAKVEFPVAG